MGGTKRSINARTFARVINSYKYTPAETFPIGAISFVFFLSLSFFLFPLLYSTSVSQSRSVSRLRGESPRRRDNTFRCVQHRPLSIDTAPVFVLSRLNLTRPVETRACTHALAPARRTHACTHAHARIRTVA